MTTGSVAGRLARRLDARGIHYGWVVAAVSFLTLITAAGFRSTVGVLIVPLQDEFGWSRATISAAVAINLVLYGLGGPFAAGLYDRFGVRKVIVIALATIATSSALTTQIGRPWQLDLLWGVSNGLATGAIGVTLAAVIANRWFAERRGLVTGMLTASNATGQLVFLPLLGWIVTVEGWRSAATTVSVVALAFTLPLVLLFLRDSPAEIGLRPFGAVVDDPPIVQQNPFRAAIGGFALASRTSTFWLLTASFFVCGATTNGLIGTHLIPAAMDHGMSEVTAASLLAVIGVFDLVGTLCSGWLTDRFDPRWLLFWYYGLRGLSLLRAAVRDRLVQPRADRIRGLLRARLGRDRAADGGDHGSCLRSRARRRRLRLDLLRPSARRRRRRLERRRGPHVVRRLPVRLRHGRPARRSSRQGS